MLPSFVAGTGWGAAVCTAAITATASLGAQQPRREPPRVPLVTIAGWADETWISMLDRDGSYFGRLATEGTFQRFNPLMDHEYEFDVWSGRFSAADDARWATVRRGLRVAGASLSHAHLLNDVEWREDIPVAGPVALVARYVRDHSLAAQRDFLRTGVRWRGVAGSPWEGSITIGVHFLKPSADLEIGAARRWGDDVSGWELDARIAALDGFNNLVFGSLGVPAAEREAHFDYRMRPFAARVALSRRARRWRADLHAGTSNTSALDVTFPATGAEAYQLRESVAFTGLSAELALPRGVAVAAYGTWARATAGRVFASTPDAESRVREGTGVAGLRARYPARALFAVELDARVTWRPEDRSGRDIGTVTHRDREVLAAAALVHTPLTGWAWRISLGTMDRDAGPLAASRTAVNRRTATEGGYRFASGFSVTAGVRWDLDRSSTNLFDGGHLRFSAAW